MLPRIFHCAVSAPCSPLEGAAILRCRYKDQRGWSSFRDSEAKPRFTKVSCTAAFLSSPASHNVVLLSLFPIGKIRITLAPMLKAVGGIDWVKPSKEIRRMPDGVHAPYTHADWKNYLVKEDYDRPHFEDENSRAQGSDATGRRY